MLPFRRAQVATLGERLAEEPHRLISLFGPSQTGKTTIVQQALRKISQTAQKYLAVDRPWPPATRVSPLAGDALLSPPRERGVAWLEERWIEAQGSPGSAHDGVRGRMQWIAKHSPKWAEFLFGWPRVRNQRVRERRHGVRAITALNDLAKPDMPQEPRR